MWGEEYDHFANTKRTAHDVLFVYVKSNLNKIIYKFYLVCNNVNTQNFVVHPLRTMATFL
jgi:hypothetical protein